MLKPLSAASAPPRSVPAEPVTGLDPQATAGFADALEAARQAAQQGRPQTQGNAPATAAGAPTAPPKSAPSTATPQQDASTATPQLDAPAVMRGGDGEPANGSTAARSAGVPVRSRDREDPAASPPAKSAADGRPDASAAAEPVATAAVTLDSLAGGVMQAAPGTADPGTAASGTGDFGDGAVAANAGEAGSAANPAMGRVAESGAAAASPAAGQNVAAAPDNAAGAPGSTATSPSGSAAQSLLAETIAPGTFGLLTPAQPSVAVVTPTGNRPAAAAFASSAAAAASALAAASPPQNGAAGTRPLPAPPSATPAAGNNAAPTGLAQQASGTSGPSVSSLVDTIRRTTGIEVDRIAISTGSAQAAPASSIDAIGAPPVDLAPGGLAPGDLASGDQASGDLAIGDLAPGDQPPPAAIGAVDPNALFAALDGRNPLAAAAANGGLAGPLSGSTAQAGGSAVTPMRGQEGGGTTAAGGQAIDLQPFSIPSGELQTTQASAAGAARSLPANGGVPPSVTSQITPALVSMAQAGGSGGRLSVSITPEQLGQVHITVERAADGTTSIHVAAEQLGTLNILRHDQADLTRALDQAGVGHDGHSLSFSWEGGGSSGDGGTQGWNTPNQQRGEYQPANISKSYATDLTGIPSAAAVAARGGIDLTA